MAGDLLEAKYDTGHSSSYDQQTGCYCQASVGNKIQIYSNN